MKYRNKKLYNIIFILILSVIILYTVISYIAETKKNSQKNQEKTKQSIGYSYAKPSHSIQGFKYIGYSGSKQFISIRCRQFKIHRKKLGFIRFALMKQAVLSDAAIKFYLYSERDANGSHKGFASKAVSGVSGESASALMENEEIKKAFAALASKKSGLLSEFKHISSIIARPVTVEFLSDDQHISSISALIVRVSLSNRKIVFKRNVVIVSGKKKMMLDELELNPETMLLTGTNYIFYSPEGKKSGKRIITNFRLQRVFE